MVLFTGAISTYVAKIEAIMTRVSLIGAIWTGHPVYYIFHF